MKKLQAKQNKKVNNLQASNWSIYSENDIELQVTMNNQEIDNS